MLDEAKTQLLVAGARHLGVDLSDKNLARLSLYLEEIQRWSKITDLVSQTDPETIIRKHFLDSLAVSPLIPSACRLLDLGSGAGFPGLVLAVVAPARDVVLIEARRKRVSFLKEVIRRTQTRNVQVYEGRAEVLATEETLRASFAAVVTRATWQLEDFLRLAKPFLIDQGIAVAMKGRHVEKELTGAIQQRLKAWGFSLEKRYSYVLPSAGEQRELVILKRS